MDLVNSRTVDYFVAERPMESVNGDMAFVESDQRQMFVSIFDGAGHGKEAHSIAQASRSFLEKNRNVELPVLMQALHEKLRGTRGGVGLIGKLDIAKMNLYYVGVGNIVLKKFGTNMKSEVTQGGIIGYQIRSPQERVLELSRGDVVVMHTDGISSKFGLNDYPRILRDDAQTIAKNLIKKFGKNDDDATCLVIRI